MDYQRAKEEILNQMKQHLEKKCCDRSQEEYLDLNPAEPGLAYTDGYYIYQSDCCEAKKLNLKMRNLLSEMRKKKNNENKNEVIIIL